MREGVVGQTPATIAVVSLEAKLSLSYPTQ